MTDAAQAHDPSRLREAVRTRYTAAARAMSAGAPGRAADALAVLDTGSACCEQSADKDLVTRDLYPTDDLDAIPSAAILASLGCGNPTALAELKPGEIVLDLGSGGGIDVLLSARRVGPTGFAYGLDMTDEMLALAQRTADQSGIPNVRFLKGEIEHIPLPDCSVDVLISNCVINLSTEKAQVLREAFRVLRPGGRFAVSDVVVQGHLPADLRQDMEQWVGCIAGALEEDTYRRLLARAGFDQIDVEVTRVSGARDISASDTPAITQALAAVEAGAGRLVSAFVRAVKPVCCSVPSRHAAQPSGCC